MKRFKYVFIVLVYKNTDVLDGFFASLKEKVVDYKVILVNSYYDDSSLESCREYAIKFGCDFIEIPNKGYGAGNNVGIKYAIDNYDFDFLIISNSDIIVRKLDGLDKFVGKEAVIGPETIMLTGKHQNPCLGRYPTLTSLFFMLCRSGYKRDSKVLITLAHVCSRLNKIITKCYLAISGRRELKVLSIHGSFFVMTDKAVRKMFPVFSDEMFLYNEEFYMGMRAKQNDIPVYFSKDNIVNHLEGASSTGDFWKQYPQFKKSFAVLNRYIEEGRFDNENTYNSRKGFLSLRRFFSGLGG